MKEGLEESGIADALTVALASAGLHRQALHVSRCRPPVERIPLQQLRSDQRIYQIY